MCNLLSCVVDIILIISMQIFSKIMNILKYIYGEILILLNYIYQLFLVFADKFNFACLFIFEYFKLKLYYNNLLIVVKLFCLIILLKSGFDVTSDYLSYPFEYKLIVLDSKYGFDFPSISVCTENNVLFDKRKIIEHFGLHTQWKEYEKILFEEFTQIINACNETFEDYRRNPNEFLKAHNYDFICYININSSKLFVNKIENLININLHFDEMLSLTINTNELFDCSANIHFRNESFDSNANKIDNCFDYFDALKSIYANKDFGICFEFFAKNYSFYLKDNDYIDIIVKYSAQNNLFINAFQDMNYRFLDIMSKGRYYNPIKYELHLYFDKYFGLYLFVDPKTRHISHNRDIAFKSTQKSLNAELKLTKSSVKLLGKPYMNECVNYGKFS